ncbi:hypothetical protein AB0425_17235 [Actinosynnema sp. NPDC051121]
MPTQREPEPEIVSRQLMPARARDGSLINLGAGITDRGGITLLNTAPDGIAIVTTEGASTYMGLIRKMVVESVSWGSQR